MTTLGRALTALWLLLLLVPVRAQPPAKPEPPAEPVPPPKPALPAKLELCGLAPGKRVANLCLLRYPVSTTSAECQAFFDQGLAYLYSYVWMEAARSFETATAHDPDCALAWWGLSRALEKWNRNTQATTALEKADQKKAHASWREQQLILARMQEKGQAPGVGEAEERKKKAIATVDNLLAIHDDDEEGWYYRAHLAGGTGFGGQVSAVPFFKALLRLNPLHPGANHELVHYYENSQRPALGWPHAEAYIKSSPGLPHAFHMQAHLAMRIGKWDRTTDWSARAVDLEKAYHKDMDVKPSQDHQYTHHLETLLRSLIHDGRFAEARAVKADMMRHNSKQWDLFFRLHVGERDWAEAFKVVDQFRKTDKNKASYLSAIIYLRQGDVARAGPEIEVLRGSSPGRRGGGRKSNPELQLWETQGLYLCLTGSGDAGVKLLERAVKKTKDDYSHHAWGNGAYYMETWGVGALKCGKLDVAEEAFLESLAHDSGSARAAMGLQILCERQNRPDEARRYAELARRCWGRASAEQIDAEYRYLRQPAGDVTKTSSADFVGPPEPAITAAR